MYSLIWRIMPGPRYVKALQMLLLVSVAAMCCFWWLFPWLNEVLELSGNTVGH